MSWGVAFGGDLGKLIFDNDATGTGIAALGTGLSASGTAGSLYLCLGTSAPASPQSDATSNEITYPNYARQALARSTGGWTMTNNVLTNAAGVTWPTVGTTASTYTASHWWITTGSSGATRILLWGTVTSPPTFGQNSSPQAGSGQLTATIV